MRKTVAVGTSVAVLAVFVVVAWTITHSDSRFPADKPHTVKDQSDATKSLIEGLFAAYERGDSKPLFDHVSDDVDWTIAGTNPLSGEYHSKREFLAATYTRLAAVLKEPVRPVLRRIVAQGDVAVVEWRGHSISIADEPYDNDYCWVIHVAGDQIVEVRAYFDGGLVAKLFRATEKH
jgi:uncharacterized protein